MKNEIKSVGVPSDAELFKFHSFFDLNQVVTLKFREGDNPLQATIRGVHFFSNREKYDLGLWLGDGSVDNPEHETRIYNVDSVFVTPA